MTQTKPASKSIAVIGAGISGIQAAAYLLKQGLHVVVFERSSQCGGVWNYSDTPAPEPTWPSNKPSAGEYRTTRPGQTSLFDEADREAPRDSHGEADDGMAKKTRGESEDELRRAFAPASACWTGITTNIPSCLMVSELAPWPSGTKNLIPHQQVQSYVQSLAVVHGAHAVTEYNTRVESVRKSADGSAWDIRTVTLRDGDASAPAPAPPLLLDEKTWRFDAVVVANGHNTHANVPDIPGLAEWKKRFPTRLMHSMQYRRPDFARGKKVLVIGGGTSTLNICEELVAIGAREVIQGVRGSGQLPAHIWPKSVRRVPCPVRFELLDEDHAHHHHDLDDTDAAIPGRIHLAAGPDCKEGEEEGEVLDDIDHVILTTGFLCSMPFLSHLHRDDLSPADAGPFTLITSDGKLTHNLHKDIFYIEDPTLAFIGIPIDVATFNVFDFQAQAVARVFAGIAELPSRGEMRQEYEARVAAKGLLKKALHSLSGQGEPNYVRDIVDWCNRDAERLGAQKMRGHSEKWLEDRNVFYMQVMDLMKGVPGAKWPGAE